MSERLRSGRVAMSTWEPERRHLALMLALTFTTGIVDAVGYLGLDRVFTANMTGNVVVLGFAAAGAPGFSVPATLTSLGAFLLGALGAGLLTRRIMARSLLLTIAVVMEAVLGGVAAAVAYLSATVASGAAATR